MTTARFIVGDSLTVLRTLPAASVDLVVTSPPFLALRSYLPDDHPDKAKEMGSEATPGEFIDALLDVVEECRRVLAPHGSLCVELGDTYSGSGGATDGRVEWLGGSDMAPRPTRNGRQSVNRDSNYNTANPNTKGKRDGWPLDKSLILIPESFRFALVYGRNPFTGRETEPWRLRNAVRWCKPNPAVGALGDKFRTATSEIAVACTSRTRYFDLDAVRGDPSPNTHARTARVGEQRRPNRTPKASSGGNNNRDTLDISNEVHPSGAPPLDWWKISVRGYPGQHYATYPPELIDRLVKAMCPQRVCTVCGQPSRRVVDPCTLDAYRASERPQTIRAVALADEHGLTDEHIAAVRAFGTSDAGRAKVLNNGAGKNSAAVKTLAAEAKTVLGGYFREFVMSTNAAPTSSFTDCGHDSWRRGVVLDPFAGSGTTLAVATGHGHDAIGIDLDERNLHLARERVGMFLEEAVA